MSTIAEGSNNLHKSISSISDVFLHKKYSDKGSLPRVLSTTSTKLPSNHSIITLISKSMESEVLNKSTSYTAAQEQEIYSYTSVESKSVESKSLETIKSPSSSSDSSYSSESLQSIDSKGHARLTHPENSAVISVFEDTIDQLEILRHLLPHSFDKYEGYATLEERHGGAERSANIVCRDEATTEAENHLMKVQRDRLYAEAVIIRTVIELEKNNTFGPLEEAIVEAQQMDEDDAFLLEEAKANEDLVVQLRAELTELETGKKVTVDTTELAVMHLKDQTYETMLQTGIRTRYVTRWEKSREAQKHYMNTNEENRLLDNMNQIFNDTDSENRTNQEIETFIIMTKQEMEDSIEHWMELYDRESEERDQAIIQIRMEREIHMRNLVELQNTFDLHRKEMNEWKEKKEQRRIKAEREAFLYKMATRIQAWWRGLMYRLRLGPYRKKKKGKGKGKGGSKKGGVGKGGKQKGKPTKGK